MTKVRKIPTVLGIILGFFNAVGYITKNNDKWLVGKRECVIVSMSIIVFLIVTNIVFCCFDYLSNRKCARISNIFRDKRNFLIFIVFVIIAFWTPIYLGVYPGLVNYDAPEQIYQYVNNCVTEHHPVLHTLLFGKILSLAFEVTNNLTTAVAIYFIFQLSMFLLFIIYIFAFIYDIKAPIWICAIAIFYYAIFPPTVVHFMCVTKDNYFSLFLVCFIICNYRLFSNPDEFFCRRLNLFLWFLFTLGTLFFRNNAIYAIILLAPAWIIYSRKLKNKNCISMVAIVVLLFVFYKCVLVNMLCVDGIDKREMLSVPAQQMVRIYNCYYSNLSEEQISTYEHLFSKVDTVSYYEPLIADASKAAIDMEFLKNNASDCRKLYFSMMLNYPMDYIFSFLKNTYGYWYLYPELILTAEKDYGYIVLYSFEPFLLEPKSMAIYELYYRYFNGFFTDSNCAISCLAFPGFYFYFLLVCLFYNLEKKNVLNCWMMTFVVILWLTFLLGPVVLVRYIMFLFLLVPVLFVFCFDKSSDIVEKKNVIY